MVLDKNQMNREREKRSMRGTLLWELENSNSNWKIHSLALTLYQVVLQPSMLYFIFLSHGFSPVK